ncbi:MAG: cellulase family glycosylhydrolase [Oscillospiraceae bacterium]|nr:cellulase family glycosylhydrolase [Oscillospiraceae bacterium]
MKKRIKRTAALLCAMLLVINLLISIVVSAEDMALTAHSAVQQFTVGWNLGNALDCYESPEFGVDGMASEELWGNPPVARELIQEVHKAGFNAIRIPVTWYNHMDPNTNEIDREWLDRVKTVVDYAMDDGMYSIINVHHDTGEKGWMRASRSKFEQDNDIFVNIWQQLCEEYRDYNDHLLFEGFNELLDENNVWDEPSEEALEVVNDYNQLFVDTVRASGGNNEKRVLVVKTYCASSAYKTLDAFQMPTDTAEDRIIASVHVYRPMDFTNERYPEITNWSAYELDPHIARLNEYFVKKDIPLIIEEFGCVDKSNLNERVTWSEYYVQEFTKLGVPCFWWDNGNEYKLFDRERNTLCAPELVGTIVAAAKGETYKPDPVANVLAILKTTFQTDAVCAWTTLALISAGILFLLLLFDFLVRKLSRKNHPTYNDLFDERGERVFGIPHRILLIVSWFALLVYLSWRIRFSLPLQSGVIAIAGSILLLLVEILGFFETIEHYKSMLGTKKHPLPEIADDEYPEVDIFIATYNEPCDLLRRTINGCKHIKYPDKSKVHIWVCDDNRRKEMRALAEEMGVGYFDRPDNKGAKAGNLNHAMGLTSAPYVVTLDADMIPKSDFLLKTIPYFVDAKKRSAADPKKAHIKLGFIQTPQCFYDPDVFQHALYCEHNVPNEQNFFYQNIEPARTSTNSVIYGGSNTILAREALDAIGGFYTESITEDFATGLLIESAGYVSLGLPEPLASGRTPHTFKEHIQQRTRWGRGVIVTAKKLKIFRRKELSLDQKMSYWGSAVYWLSPIKNLIYIFAPLMFAVFGIPIFYTGIAELVVFWLPMYVLSDIALRCISGRAVSSKWSGIYETSVMPHLLIPIIQESLGISLTKFKVTDKSGKGAKRKRDLRSMVPFIVLILLTLAGIVRVCIGITFATFIQQLVILFWLIRNLYYLSLALFLIDGRDSSGEPVKVIDAEPITLKQGDTVFEGITTRMNEHRIRLMLDDPGELRIGDTGTITITGETASAELQCVIISSTSLRQNGAGVFDFEILDFGKDELEYMQILYDRLPSLPMELTRDFGIFMTLWRNIVARLRRPDV